MQGTGPRAQKRNPHRYTPRGIVSPLAANIYLHALDRYMESRYLCLPKWQRQQRRRQGKANFLYLRLNMILWCYAMGMQRASPRDERGTWGTPQQHGTQLSEEKTKVTHITEGFNFLGYRIMRSIGTSGKMIPKVLIPARPSHASAMPYAECLPQPTYESVKAKIIALNSLIRMVRLLSLYE